MVHRVIKFSLYGIILILINLIAQNYFLRWDLTRTKMYSLSPLSKEAVSNLQEPLTIKAFFSKDLPPPYNTIARYLQDLLEEYSSYGGKNFNYEIYDISPDNKYASLAQDYGITPVQVQVVQRDELKYRSIFMGLVIIHGDAMEKIPVITTTNRLEYLLTSAIDKLKNKVSYLLSLKGKIEVDFYLSPSLQHIAPLLGIKGMDSLPSKIEKIVDRMNRENYNKLKFRFIPIKINRGDEEKYSKMGLQVLRWPSDSAHHLQGGSGGIGLILRYGKESFPVVMLRVYRIPLIGTQYILTSSSEIKDILETGIQSLLHLNETIGYLTDHGTLSLYKNPMAPSPSVDAFRELLSKAYDIKEISLKKGIPDGIHTLIIAGPRKKFTDYELFELDQALMRGTNLAIFLDNYVEDIRIPGQLRVNKVGLDRLLKHYGIILPKGIVMDKECYHQQIPRSQGGGERPVYFAPVIKDKNINHKLPYLRNIKGLVMLKVSPVLIDSKRLKMEDVKAYRLFSSSKKSWLAKNIMSLNPTYIYPPEDKKMKSYPLAYLLEGKFTSYFADKPIPPKTTISKDKNKKASSINGTSKEQSKEFLKEIKTQGTKLSHGRWGKIFIMGSSDVLTDTIIDAQGDNPNSIFIMNMIDVLNDKIQRAILRSKIEDFNPLYDISDNIKMMIKLFNIFGVPIIVILCGLLILFFRKRKKMKVYQLFNG